MAALRRIDSHCHIVPSFYADACMAVGAIPARGGFPEWSPQRALDVMDANDIEVAVVSVVPGVHFFAPDKARDMARRCNEFAAELCARFPSRFGAFALVPMHEARHAVAEIDHAYETLKLDGVCFLSNYGEHYLGDPLFDPVLAAVNERAGVAFVHPYHAGRHVPGSGRDAGLPYPSFMLEYPFDTTRMATHLMFTAALERFAKIRFILPHAGGALPWFAWRLYISQMVSPHAPQWSYETMRTELKHFWYDTALSAGAEMLECLLAMVGPDHVVFGSDWPMANDQAVAECVTNLSTGLASETRRAAFARDNALALFPRFGNGRAPDALQRT